jgi:acetate kinase
MEPRYRRYGFHGVSHHYVAAAAAPAGGAEAGLAASGQRCQGLRHSGGQSVDTSMGFTPPDAPVSVLAVPTDEELEIARATHACYAHTLRT